MALVSVRTQPIYGLPGSVTRRRLVAAILALQSLVGYWRLNDLTTVIKDWGPLGLNGTAGANVTYGAGALIPGDPLANSCGFPGNSGGTISVANTGALSLGDKLTIMALVSPTGAGSQGILSKGAGAYYMRLVAGLFVDILKSNVADIGNSSRTIATGSVHHVAWTKSGSTNLIYIDGLAATGSMSNATLQDNAGALTIGNDTGFSEFFVGRMAEVVLSSVAQSPTTIRQIALLALGAA